MISAFLTTIVEIPLRMETLPTLGEVSVFNVFRLVKEPSGEFLPNWRFLFLWLVAFISVGITGMNTYFCIRWKLFSTIFSVFFRQKSMFRWFWKGPAKLIQWVFLFFKGTFCRNLNFEKSSLAFSSHFRASDFSYQNNGTQKKDSRLLNVPEFFRLTRKFSQYSCLICKVWIRFHLHQKLNQTSLKLHLDRLSNGHVKPGGGGYLPC